ncbi:hypothetical protein [Streptomyces sp. 11x1]|uniref:hypothetical protein n=1 Tax=Streptomyces sp. 11x1 TaxID=3038642 RepID=UPI00292E6E28|nr:hypothetical protein [Streptomyces sp. 11x1]WNZ06302.1 hypothetical protein P8T65_00945 [Streptomyces sp. 11x1]
MGADMRRGFVAVAAALVAVVGCGAEDDEDVIIDYGPATTPYSGPLHIETEKVKEDTPEAMLLASGAAGRALECNGEISRGGAPDGWGEGRRRQDTEDGLRLYFRMFEPGGVASRFRVEREETDRVLYSHRVDGRTKTAVVIAKDQEGRPVEALTLETDEVPSRGRSASARFANEPVGLRRCQA